MSAALAGRFLTSGPPGQSPEGFFLFFFFFFMFYLAAPSLSCSMWGSSSLTKDGTWAPCSENTVLATGSVEDSI